jgi:uncharacterized protein
VNRRYRGLLRAGVLAASTAAGAIAAYAHVVEPRWVEVTRWRLRVPDLPPAWEGLHIVHLSDPQIGMWGQPDALLARAIRITLGLRPDAVFLTGDVVHRGRWEPAAGMLRALTAATRVYVVLGNHDYADGHVEDVGPIVAALRALGATVLMNEHAWFCHRGERWMVVGVDDLATHHTDLLRAITGIPRDTRLLALLTHVPEVADVAPPGWFPLTVAGHTHGAQVRIPGILWLDPLLLRNHGIHAPYRSGFYQTAGGPLYVNRGIGMSLLPIRLGARPEVTLFVLTDGRALPAGVRWARLSRREAGV